jgi:hypothetical protein
VQLYAGAIERAFAAGGGSAIQSQKQLVLPHEIGHHFQLNKASLTPLHDTRKAWCSDDNQCGSPVGTVPDGGIVCIMDGNQTPQVSEIRFCIEDLVLGDPLATPDNAGRKPFSLRGAEDPL